MNSKLDVNTLMERNKSDRHSDSKVLAEEIRRKEALGMHMG